MAVASAPTTPRTAAAGAATYRRLTPLVLLVCLVAILAYATFAQGAYRLPAEAYVQFALAAVCLVGCAVWLFGSSVRLSASREGWIGFGLLVCFALWCGLSIIWSVAPDRSWTEANRAIAYALVVVAGIAIGASLPDAPRRLGQLYGILAVVTALYALGGKTIPGVHINGLFHLDQAGQVSRLRAPLFYWNALALVCVMALPLYLGRAADPRRTLVQRGRSTAAMFVLGVTAGLTYSRGGVLALIGALGVFFVVYPYRWRSLAVLGVTVAGVAVSLLFAFSRKDLKTNTLPLHDRTDDGLLLSGVLIVVLAAVLVGLWLIVRNENRWTWTPQQSSAARRYGLLGFAAIVVVGLILGAATGKIGDARERFIKPSAADTTDPNRLLSSNSGNRWTWWKEAVGAWSDKPLAGYGAGSFPVTHLQYRKNNLDVLQPHSVPLQFLAETGLIGFIFGFGAMLALLAAVLARVRSRVDDPVLLATIAGIPMAYFLHSFYDWDWDLPAVTMAALLFAGVLAATPLRRVEEDLPRVVGDGRGIGLAAAVLLLCGVATSAAFPWLSQQINNGVFNNLPDRPTDAQLQHAESRAQLASRLNPTSVAPLYAAASLAERRGSLNRARAYLLQAGRRQPDALQTWLRLARIEFARDDRAALDEATRKALSLDPRNGIVIALASRTQSAATPPNESPSATGTPLSKTIQVPGPGSSLEPGVGDTGAIAGPSPLPDATPVPTPDSVGIPSPTPTPAGTSSKSGPTGSSGSSSATKPNLPPGFPTSSPTPSTGGSSSSSSSGTGGAAPPDLPLPPGR